MVFSELARVGKPEGAAQRNAVQRGILQNQDAIQRGAALPGAAQQDASAARDDFVRHKRTTNRSEPDANSQGTIFNADGSLSIANPSANCLDRSLRVRRALIVYLAAVLNSTPPTLV